MKSFYQSVMLSLICITLTSCAALKTQNQPVVLQCASIRIAQAYDMHHLAKTKLAEYLNSRSLQNLVEAYYAAIDSVYMGRLASKCQDRQINDLYAYQNLFRLNYEIWKIVRINLPDENGLLMLYGDQYSDLIDTPK